MDAVVAMHDTVQRVVAKGTFRLRAVRRSKCRAARRGAVRSYGAARRSTASGANGTNAGTVNCLNCHAK